MADVQMSYSDLTKHMAVGEYLQCCNIHQGDFPIVENSLTTADSLFICFSIQRPQMWQETQLDCTSNSSGHVMQRPSLNNTR